MSLQHIMPTPMQSTCTRRSTLLSAAGLLSLTSRPTQPARAAAEVLQVGPGQAFTSIAAAVAAAQPGSTVSIAPGRYQEQLVISSSITLAAAQQEGRVVIVCDTQQPYVHCLEVPSSSGGGPLDVRVRGICFEHYSKSVANNYCVFAQAGSITLEQCDITSSSGVGVGVEGAAVRLKGCHIHDCERHGLAVFGSLEGDVGRCEVSDCSITSNKLNGVLVKDGANLTVSASDISANGGYGVQLSDCTATLQQNSVARNRQGSVAAELGTVTVDEKQLEAENKLSDGLVLL